MKGPHQPNFLPIQPWVRATSSPPRDRFGLHYREFPPPGTLADWIVGIWTLAGDGRGDAVHHYHVVPDGCSDLIFDRQNGEGFIFGTVSAAKTVEMSGQVSLVGVRLQPHLLPAFTGIPASAVRDVEPSFREASLTDWCQVFEAHLPADTRVFSARAADSLARAVAAKLHPERINIRARWLTSALLDGGGSVDQAAHATGFSHRQLQRIARHELGLSPKLMGRILRMQQALRAVFETKDEHALLAAAHGYADQAHMIREFTTLTGHTPGFWRLRRMSDLFNLQQRTSGKFPP